MVGAGSGRASAPELVGRERLRPARAPRCGVLRDERAHLPCVLRATAPFVYVRLHGPDPEHLYAGSYSDDSLSWWAARVRDWELAGHEVYAYFNNDGHGYAVGDAKRLRSQLATW